MSHLIILTTLPDSASAERLAKHLISKSLAACVNILPAMQSIYQWQGEMQQGTEHQLVIKTTDKRYDEIENEIKKTHPYELPEIIALSIQQGYPDYLDWVSQTTRETDALHP